MSQAQPGSATTDKRAMVGGHLKAADKYIREGKINEAVAELAKVRAIDPTNAYAFAFEERIAALKNPPPEKPKQQVPAAPKPVEAPPKDTPAPATAQPKDKPVEAKATAPTPAAPTPNVRVDVEVKLEDEYQKKFASEIQKAEQRVTDALAKEEEKHATERAQMLDQLQKERTKYKEQIEQEFNKKLKDELEQSEQRYRKQLEDERKRAEAEISAQAKADLQSKAKELELSLEKERNSLAVKEQETLSTMKKDLEKDFATRLHSELDKIKTSSKHDVEETLIEREQSVRAQLQKEFEKRIGDERSSIESRYKTLQQQIEETSKKQQLQMAEDSKRLLEQKLEEVKKSEAKKFEEQRLALQKSLEKDHEAKLQERLAEERKKSEEEAEKVLQSAKAQFEKDKNALLENEQQKLEELRKTLKEEMQKEVSVQVEQSAHEISRSYEHRMALLGIEVPKTKEQKLKVYESRVREAWLSGPFNVEKAQILMELQELLELGFDEHSECESGVRLQLYADAVQKAILGGTIQPNDSKALEELKERFQISVEEASNVEPLILSAFQRASVKAVILVVDDDNALADIITERLKEQKYSVITLYSLAEAMKLVETTSVDLILSDIQFKGEKGDGFTFFKFVQQKPHLRRTPFILMSSLDEGLFIRTGVQLGVDDYLTKPLDLDLLMAVIEGKLKKYRSMN